MERPEQIVLRYGRTLVTCSTCGNTFETRSTKTPTISIDACPKCHPFWLGKLGYKRGSTQIDRFNKRYARPE